MNYADALEPIYQNALREWEEELRRIYGVDADSAMRGPLGRGTQDDLLGHLYNVKNRLHAATAVAQGLAAFKARTVRRKK